MSGSWNFPSSNTESSGLQFLLTVSCKILALCVMFQLWSCQTGQCITIFEVNSWPMKHLNLNSWSLFMHLAVFPFCSNMLRRFQSLMTCEYFELPGSQGEVQAEALHCLENSECFLFHCHKDIRVISYDLKLLRCWLDYITLVKYRSCSIVGCICV